MSIEVLNKVKLILEITLLVYMTVIASYYFVRGVIKDKRKK